MIFTINKHNIDAKDTQNKRAYEDLMGEARRREDYRRNDQQEQDRIIHDLKSIRKEKAGHLKEDRIEELRKLDEKRKQVEQELNEMDQSM
jgi:hypothetical protein